MHFVLILYLSPTLSDDYIQTLNVAAIATLKNSLTDILCKFLTSLLECTENILMKELQNPQYT